MTEPNSCVEGVPQGPVGDPTAIHAIATKLRNSLNGEGDLTAASSAASATVGQMSDWKGAGATGYRELVPKVTNALDVLSAAVLYLANSTDQYAIQLDDVQGQPNDGRRDTWWGLVEAVGTTQSTISTLNDDIQRALKQPVLTPASDPFPAFPKSVTINTDVNSILDGTTSKQLSQWECNAWMDREGFETRLLDAATAITTLKHQLSAYQTRVDTWNHTTAPQFFSSRVDNSATGAASGLPNVSSFAFVPRAGDPPIPLSEMASYTVVVEPGDNLTTIAEKAYGNTDWQKIYAGNKRTIGGDPNLILPGQTLTITSPTSMNITVPLSEIGIKTYASEPETYVPTGPVVPGDSTNSKSEAKSSVYNPTPEPAKA